MKQVYSCDGVMRADASRYGYSIVKLCHGFSEDMDFFAFVAIEPHNLDYFQSHYKPGKHSHFEPFGKELLRGAGVEPPADIFRHIEDRFGVRFCRDETSAQALARMIAEDLSRPENDGATIFSFPVPEQALHALSGENYERPPEKPARLTGS